MSHDVALRTILRQAYSGELTAALAYRGHWVSLRSEAEIADIQRIERDHERYFMDKVAGHPALPFWRRWFGWGPGALTGWTGSTETERRDLHN